MRILNFLNYFTNKFHRVYLIPTRLGIRHLFMGIILENCLAIIFLMILEGHITSAILMNYLGIDLLLRFGRLVIKNLQR